jgi:tetratricopeptide (TPR) repeat protein
LKRAIQIDPKFATALAILGRDYSALGEMELAREYTRKAYEERGRAGDQERFFIDFSYDRFVTGDLEKAIETCELWTHTYPRDVLGHALYAATSKALGHYDVAISEDRKALEVDPDQPYPYTHLASIFLYRNDLTEAERWLQRASDRKLNIPDFLMDRFYIAFMRRNTEEMNRIAVIAESAPEIQDWIWGERASVFAYSGRWKEAKETSRHAIEIALAANRPESAAQHEAAMAVNAALFGNLSEARSRALAVQQQSHGIDAEYGAALAFGLSGEMPGLQRLINDLKKRYPTDTIVRFNVLPTLRAISAIHHGDAAQAIDLLGPARRYELGWLGCCSVGFVGSLYPIYVRGEAYLALHQGLEAAAEFQRIIDNRGMLASAPMALLAHWKRGRALMMAGKKAEAAAEYQHFLSIWRHADEDVPIWRRVKAEFDKLAPNTGKA